MSEPTSTLSIDDAITLIVTELGRLRARVRTLEGENADLRLLALQPEIVELPKETIPVKYGLTKTHRRILQLIFDAGTVSPLAIKLHLQNITRKDVNDATIKVHISNMRKSLTKHHIFIRSSHGLYFIDRDTKERIRSDYGQKEG